MKVPFVSHWKARIVFMKGVLFCGVFCVVAPIFAGVLIVYYNHY